MDLYVFHWVPLAFPHGLAFAIAIHVIRYILQEKEQDVRCCRPDVRCSSSTRPYPQGKACAGRKERYFSREKLVHMQIKRRRV